MSTTDPRFAPGAAGTYPAERESQPSQSHDGSGVADRAGEMATGAVTKAQETVKTSADKGMERASEGMTTAAERLRERSESAEGMQKDVALKAADAMDKTASYLKEHDSAEMMEQVERYIREHPIQAASGALVAGYLLGKILR
jgi:ElaB/YqjD/DUF883 family membrane-anchored ribosome-binding protein